MSGESVRARLHPALVLGTVAALVMLSAGGARAEFVVSGFMGAGKTTDADARLRRPGGTDLTFQGVSWRDESFTSPHYWGVRATYWLAGTPCWGLSVDFTHAKMHADLEARVPVHGTRDGTSVDARERLGDTFSTLAFSHGHNLLLAALLHRWPPADRHTDTFRGRLTPYTGGGLGLTWPHVEVEIEGSSTDEYQWSGPAVGGLAGIDVAIWRGFGLFPEYKLTYGRIDGELSGGGSIGVHAWTHHLVLGLSYGF